jgi:hypothetical protein
MQYQPPSGGAFQPQPYTNSIQQPQNPGIAPTNPGLAPAPGPFSPGSAGGYPIFGPQQPPPKPGFPGTPGPGGPGTAGGYPIFGFPQPPKPPIAVDGPGFGQPGMPQLPQQPQYTNNGQQIGSTMPNGHVIGTGQRYLNGLPRLS